MAVFMSLAVPDPDLEISGGGGGNLGAGAVSKNLVWYQNKGGFPLDPPLIGVEQPRLETNEKVLNETL